MIYNNRRTFLRFGGMSLALPLLETFTTGHEITNYPSRAVFVFVPNGVNMWEWHPSIIGKNYELTRPLINLAEFRHRLTVFSGLQHSAFPGHGELGVWLTANSKYTAGKGAVTRSSISIDQHIAESIGHQTRWPSMVVGASGGRRTISFDREGEPILADHDLAAIFSELVGVADKTRLPRRASILDLVSEQAISLRKQLGKSDEQKIDEYFDSIRSVEKRIQADMMSQQSFKINLIDETRIKLNADPYITRDYASYIDTMFELIYLALRTDTTRVVSFATTESEGGGPLKFLSCGDWHSLGHSTNDAAPDQKIKEYAGLSEYDAWWTSRLAKFLDRLQSNKEDNNDMLYNTAILYGSGMSWPASHKGHNLPILLAGGERLGFRHGQHIAFNGQKKDIPTAKNLHLQSPKLDHTSVTMSDLLRTISEQMGIDAKGFGESRRILNEIIL